MGVTVLIMMRIFIKPSRTENTQHNNKINFLIKRLKVSKIKEITLNSIINFIGNRAIFIAGPRLDFLISKVIPINDSQSGNSISFIEKKTNLTTNLLENSNATLILVPSSLLPDFTDQINQTLVFVDDPRIEFIRIIQKFFAPPRLDGKHPSANIDPSAILGSNVNVGPNAWIGEGCVIGDDTTIEAGARILRGCIVGSGCEICSGAVIGSDGFHFHYNESGELETFPHLAKVIIQDDVVVGANTCIDRGTLVDTVIGQSTKIDNLVHIGHSSIIGKRCKIIAQSFIAGNVVIGDDVWIGPSVSISNNVNIGHKASITIGSVVVKNIDCGERVSGFYAVPNHQFILSQAMKMKSNSK
jgi:UDP-3-O-[3-hydroxymyristoyl] glucosamine N-acyltransferase